MLLLKIRKQWKQKTTIEYPMQMELNCVKLQGTRKIQLSFCFSVNISIILSIFIERQWRVGLKDWALESDIHTVKSWFCHLLTVRSWVICKILWTSSWSILKWRYYGTYLTGMWRLNQVMHTVYIALFWHLVRINLLVHTEGLLCVGN